MTRLDVVYRVPPHRRRPAPILFVHGFWHGAWCWEEHFLAFFAERGYACVAPNLRGHGGSEGHERLRWTPLADFLADVVDVAQSLDRPPILVGHSMGGLIVQKYLEGHAAAAAVLLASVPPRGLLRTTLRLLARHPLATLQVGLTLRVRPLIASRERYREIFLSQGVAERDVDRFHGRLQDDSFRALLDMIALDLPDPRKVRATPMLVLGADDLLVRAGEVRATGRAFGVEASVFPGMGHAMMLDSGWRAVAERIAGWLDARGL